jgi:tetratricopeptide (TPR) repeat protein
VRRAEGAPLLADATSEPRFVMLETIREYALERLQVSGESEPVAARHAAYYLALLSDSTTALRGPGQVDALTALGAEIEQLRAAWRWAADHAQDGGIAHAADSLFHLYDMRSWFQEGAEAFGAASQALGARRSEPDLSAEEHRTTAVTWGKVLARQGWFTFHLGRQAEARALLEESLASLRALDARAEMVFALNYLGAVCSYLGEYLQTRALCEESLGLAAALGDRYGRAIACNILGQTAYELGEYAAAKAWSQQSLALEQQLGNRWSMAYSLTNLGKVASASGDYAEARRLFEQSRRTREQMGDTRGVAICLNYLGDAAVALGDPGEAWDRYTRSLALFREIGNQWGVTATLINLGRLALHQRRHAAAVSIYQEALQLALATQAVPQLATIYAAFASLLAARGETAWGADLAQLASARPATSQPYQAHVVRLLAWSWDAAPGARSSAPGASPTLDEAIAAAREPAPDGERGESALA